MCSCLTLTCPPPEGILNSISSVLPQAAGAAVSAAAAGGQGSSGPPPMNFTVPSSTGTTHIHVGTMPTPETAEPPHMGAYIGEIPFPFPGFPSNIRFGPPQVDIHFAPPRPSNQAPQRNNQRARAPQQGYTYTPRANNPPQGAIRVRGPLQSRGNIQFGGTPQAGGNIRFGHPQPGQIQVVGIRMEGVPIQVPAGGLVMGGGIGGQGGPIITPQQQQLYQQHTQQTSAGARSEGPPPQNSTTEGNQQQWDFEVEPTNPPPQDEDMELD